MAYLVILSLVLASFFRSRFVTFIFGLSLVLTLSIHGSSKLPFSDWAWYYTHFNYLFQNGLKEYFLLSTYPGELLGPFLGVKPKLLEPVTYLLAYGFQSIIGSDLAMLAGMFHLFFYATILFAVWLYFKDRQYSPQTLTLVLAASVLIVFNYTLVIHLLRTELSLGFLIIATVAMVSQRKHLSWAFFALAFFTHNSSIIFALVVIYCYAATSGGSLSLFLKISAVGIPIAVRLFLTIGWISAGKDDGGIGIQTILLDGFIFLAYVVAMLVSKTKDDDSRIDSFLLFCTMIFLSTVLISIDYPLLALRLYFYSDGLKFFFVIRTYQLLYANGRASPLFTFPTVAFGFIYVILSIDRSPLPYGADFLQVLFLF